MGSLLADFRRFARERRLEASCFLVGGSVRAILSGAKEPKDIDIAMRGNAIRAARGFAAQAGGTFVPLDERFGMARVVRADGRLDLARLRGRTIGEDLLKRDITINAMAFPLSSRRLIDPLGGAKDLMDGIVRIVSEGNLIDDPLRILRCYRFSAAGGFRLEVATAASLKRLTSLLTRPAPERITEEVKKILASQGAARTLERMMKDGALRTILPGLRAKNLLALKAMKRVCGRLRFPRRSRLQPEERAAIELAVLVSGKGGGRLVLSRRERRLLERLDFSRGRLSRLFRRGAGRAALTGMLADAGDEISAHLLYTCAFFAAEGEEEGERFLEFSRGLLSLYVKTVRPRLQAMPVNGDDLKKEFYLLPSPLFKTVLEGVRAKWLLGQVRDRREALSAAKKIIQGENRQVKREKH